MENKDAELIESILNRLTDAVSGTDKELYTKEELTKFATFYLDKWDEVTSEDVIAESFVDFWWGTDRPCRRCSVCGKIMRSGYCADMGAAYYCSKECLHTEYSDEEWERECFANDQSYYTEW
jgi:hypothetical protein